MCGIAGVLYRDPTQIASQDILDAMGGGIAHRGPDGVGYWNQGPVGLVHRRLAIIDLEGGCQPLGNEDGSVQIVFNGEIYNYQDLTRWLVSRGHQFQTRSDTEVLVHLWEEDGERLVERLRGMFAFALWDSRKRQLFLARDRVGIKPLYLYRDGEKLLFGSELKAILAHPGLSLDLDPRALEDYLAYGMVTGPRSIFRSLEKLPPGQTLLLDSSTWASRSMCYWRLPIRQPDHFDTKRWREAILEKVHDAVQAHLVADVPIGAFLSGGIDSSVMVACSAGATNGPLQTFSIGFSEQDVSELPAAREIANRYHTQHVEELVTPASTSLLDELTRFYDEPFADSSAIPTYLVSRLAARHVKVALSGDGGDEAFGGYRRYAHDLREAALRRFLPAWIRGLLGQLAWVWPKADWAPRPFRLKTLMTNLALNPGPAYANTLQICRAVLRRRLLHPDLRKQLNGHVPESAFSLAYETAPSKDPLAGMIATDVATILPDDYLVKVDRASMACGLEVRPPLLDHELLELVAGMPSDLKIKDGQTKWIFKEVFRDRLPEAILQRPKQGFEIPLDRWFRGPLRTRFQETVLASGSRLRGLIDQRVAAELLEQHGKGTLAVGPTLWSLLVLAAWADRYLGS